MSLLVEQLESGLGTGTGAVNWKCECGEGSE